jgi:hypothetical protein
MLGGGRQIPAPEGYNRTLAREDRRRPVLNLPVQALRSRDQSGNKRALEDAVRHEMNLKFMAAMFELKKAVRYGYTEIATQMLARGAAPLPADAKLQIVVTPVTTELIYHHRTAQERRVPYDTISFSATLQLPYFHYSREAGGYFYLTLSHVLVLAARVYGAENGILDFGDQPVTNGATYSLTCSARLEHRESTNSRIPFSTLQQLYVPRGPPVQLPINPPLPSIPIELLSQALPALGTTRASSLSYSKDIAMLSAARHNPKLEGYGVVYSFEWNWSSPPSSDAVKTQGNESHAQAAA